MKRPVITLTKRQVQNLLTLPEEAEIGRKEQKVKASKSELGQVVTAAQEIAFVVAKNGKKPKVVLTKRQIYAAVAQLTPKEKTRLVMFLQSQARDQFAAAVNTLWEAYAKVPTAEVQRDVTKAIKMVREERLGKGGYRQ